MIKQKDVGDIFYKVFIHIEIIIFIGAFCALLLTPLKTEYIIHVSFNNSLLLSYLLNIMQKKTNV